jgi:protein involved in polysaccharide export with SLBB domain
MKSLVLLCSSGLLAALLAGCQSSQPSFPALETDAARAAAPAVPRMETTVTNRLDPALLRPGNTLFTLGPGDRLDIEIPGNPTSRALTLVGPDGKIYYNLLPGLNVWGLTLAETRELLEKELGKYMTAPQVSVTLREVGSKYIWVLGRLNKPGVYPITGPITLLESLAGAGGTASSASQISTEELADLRHSFVMRQGQFLPVDFYRLLREGDTSQNVYLQPDDFVYVRSALAQEVYVLGAVRFPRAVAYNDRMSLVSAIAGGSGPMKFDYLSVSDTGPFQKDAYLAHVAIVRGSLAVPQITVVDYNAVIKGKAPDVRLEPGDIVYVPNSPFTTLKRYANMIVNTFIGTVAVNEGVHAAGGQVQTGVSVPVGTGVR